MKGLAIIPARGGSKRIPRKNIRPFLGQPIMAYSIIAALESKLFSEVMVSTEDEEMAEVAVAYGASFPFRRSEKNADDYATTLDVIREVLDQYADKGQNFDAVCCIYATAPFVSSQLLQDSYERFVAGGFDSLFPVLRYDFPIQRAMRRDAQGRVSMLQPAHLTTRSQDLEPTYHDCGMFYWLKPDVVLPKNKLWTNNSGSIVLSSMEAHDIDTVEDWAMAELKYRQKMGRHEG